MICLVEKAAGPMPSSGRFCSRRLLMGFVGPPPLPCGGLPDVRLDPIPTPEKRKPLCYWFVLLVLLRGAQS